MTELGNIMKKSQSKYLNCISASLVGRYKFILTVLLSDEMSFDQDWDLAALGDFQPYRDLIDQK